MAYTWLQLQIKTFCVFMYLVGLRRIAEQHDEAQKAKLLPPLKEGMALVQKHASEVDLLRKTVTTWWVQTLISGQLRLHKTVSFVDLSMSWMNKLFRLVLAEFQTLISEQLLIFSLLRVNRKQNCWLVIYMAWVLCHVKYDQIFVFVFFSRF